MDGAEEKGVGEGVHSTGVCWIHDELDIRYLLYALYNIEAEWGISLLSLVDETFLGQNSKEKGV